MTRRRGGGPAVVAQRVVRAEVGRAVAASAAHGGVVFASELAAGSSPREALRRGAGAVGAGAARELSVRVVKNRLDAGLRNMASAGVARATAQIGKAGAKKVAPRLAGQAARTAFRGNFALQSAVLIVDQTVDTARLVSGRIDRREYRARSAENVGGAVGGLAGGMAGAALGTLLCPGIGTFVGGMLGNLIGGAGGAVAGRSAAD